MADKTITRRGIGFTEADMKAINNIRRKHGMICLTQAVRKAIYYYVENSGVIK